jgi:hypothetical protein
MPSTRESALADPDPRYKAILAIAARTGWPASFQDELYVHDRRFLAEHPGEAVVFGVREKGTQLYPVQCDASDAYWARHAIHWHSGEHRLNYYADGERRPQWFLISDAGLAQPLSWREAIGSLHVVEAE